MRFSGLNLVATRPEIERAAADLRPGFVPELLTHAREHEGVYILPIATWRQVSRRYLRPRPGGALLGDRVHRLAQPVARWLDRLNARLPRPLFRRRLATCAACQGRRRRLNVLDAKLRLRLRAWLRRLSLLLPFSPSPPLPHRRRLTSRAPTAPP